MEQLNSGTIEGVNSWTIKKLNGETVVGVKPDDRCVSGKMTPQKYVWGVIFLLWKMSPLP